MTLFNFDFLHLIKLCGPVKSWKRPQDPTSGTLKGYGFCEFDSAEGILRAIRLLSKLNIDGQELMVCFELICQILNFLVAEHIKY